MWFVRGQQVLVPIDAHTARDRGWSIIGTKWIDIDKGDADRPNYRSRLVAQEFNTGIGRDPYGENFAATPPIESLRSLLSVAATRRSDGNRSVIAIANVKRVYFEAEIQRDVCVRIPEEYWAEGSSLGMWSASFRSAYMARGMLPTTGKNVMVMH